MEPEKLSEVKQLVEQCKSDPSILNSPSLSFFKTYIHSMRGRTPDVAPTPEKVGEGASHPKERQDGRGPKFPSDDGTDEDIVESDVELDDSDVLKPDNDPPQKMGDPSIDVTEERRDAAQLSKSKAIDALCEGKADEAVDHLTEAIVLNPQSAILYATRASIFVKMYKPNAAIRDADAALQINSDSAKGYKVRGTARAMLGQWEQAAKDLREASRLDYDEEINLMLKKVEPKAHKIEEHRRKYERLRKEREKRKIERVKQQRLAEKEAAAASSLKDGQVIGIHSNSELEQKLNAASKASRVSVMYFTATWCGPCRYISPVITSMAQKYPNVVFLKIDIDEARDAAGRWNISSVPSFFFVKNGKEIDQVVGADKDSLERKVAQYASQ